MSIDTERLARDRAYWDECAPDETATHYGKLFNGEPRTWIKNEIGKASRYWCPKFAWQVAPTKLDGIPAHPHSRGGAARRMGCRRWVLV